MEEAHEPDSLDAGELRTRLEEAEKALEEAEDDSERQRVAERDKRRWEAFLQHRRGFVTPPDPGRLGLSLSCADG